MSGQGTLNDSIPDDNSYIDPPSPTLVDFDDSNSMPDDSW